MRAQSWATRGLARCSTSAAALTPSQVPAWVHIQCGVGRRGVEAGLEAVLAPPSRGGLRFPLIVKHPSGYGSVGMTKDSKVHNEEQLRAQVSRLLVWREGCRVREHAHSWFAGFQVICLSSCKSPIMHCASGALKHAHTCRWHALWAALAARWWRSSSRAASSRYSWWRSR